MFAKKKILLATSHFCLGLACCTQIAHADTIVLKESSAPAGKKAAKLSQSEEIAASHQKPIVLHVGQKTASAPGTMVAKAPGKKGISGDKNAMPADKLKAQAGTQSSQSDASAGKVQQDSDRNASGVQSSMLRQVASNANGTPSAAKTGAALGKTTQSGLSKSGKIQSLADSQNASPLPFDQTPGKGKTKTVVAKLAPAHMPTRSLPYGMGTGPMMDGDEDGNLSLAVSSGRLLHLPGAARTVFVSDPSVADVQVPNASEVFLLGKKVGTTTVFALDGAGLPLLQRNVVVSHNLAELQKILEQRFPSLHLELKSAPGSLMVSGMVNRAEDIAAITETLKPYIGDKESLVNRLALTSPTQVNLHVRIVEVSRSVLQQIGVNWSALGGNVSLFSGRSTISNGSVLLPANSGFMGVLTDNKGRSNVIDMLDRESLLTTLAEPNLTTISGEPASFLAGGEYPIPVPQGGDSNTITVQYKDFGVGLKFTPTVQASDRITLKVNPEVSELDSANSITLLGTSIPGLTIRRLDTTVELASGQSLVLGGLLQDNARDVLSQLPGLGRLPVLGKLFSSTDYQHNKTELVVIVTPYLVRPVGPGSLQTPLDSLINPSDVEGALQHQAKLDPYDSATPHLSGTNGHVY